jgi:hypothetical protein
MKTIIKGKVFSQIDELLVFNFKVLVLKEVLLTVLHFN